MQSPNYDLGESYWLLGEGNGTQQHTEENDESTLEVLPGCINDVVRLDGNSLCDHKIGWELLSMPSRPPTPLSANW